MNRLFVVAAAAAILCSTPAAAQNYSDNTQQFLVARFAAEAGEWKQALEILDELQRKAPDDPVVRFERASVLADAGDLDRAVAELRIVTAKHPTFYDAQRLLGRILLDLSRDDSKKLDEALAHLAAALKAAPDDIQTALTIAQVYLASGRTAEAERVLAPVVERFADNRVLNFNYAQILTRLGREAEARPFLERILSADPTYVPAATQLLEMYQKGGEWKRAADTLQPLAANDPANADLQRQLGYLYLRAGEAEKARKIFETLSGGPTKDDRNQYFLAESLGDLGEHAKAEAIYKSLLEASPNDPELLLSYGLNQLAQRKLDSAATTFRSLLAVEGLPPAAQNLAKTQLAAIEYQRGNYADAVRLARESIIGPKGFNAQAVSLVIDVYRREKKYDEAVRFLQPLANQYRDPGLYARVVEFLIRGGKAEEAKNIAEQQIKSGPAGAATIAEAYMSVQQYREAIPILEELRKSHSDDIAFTYQLAAAYERNGDFEKAEKLFLALLEKAPDNASVLNYLGYMWADRGVNLERSRELLEKAVSLEPRNGAFLDSLGWVYFRLGKYDLAEKYLLDAATRVPNDATIQEHLGDLFAQRGEMEKALERYQTALKLGPESGDDSKLRVKIADIEKKSGVSRQ